MAKKFINATHIEGLIYNHSLEEKVSGPNSKVPGTKFISGTVEVATDDALVNVVPVHYTYVTAMTASGKENPTYTTLANIINGTFKTVVANGADQAQKIRIDSAIGLNEFYSDRSGTEELVSVKRNEGGFAHTNGNFTNDEALRNTFDVDIVITGVRRVDGDADKGTDDKVIVKGAIFDFRGALLPVEFSVVNPAAMNYFEGLDASNKNPVFTRVTGRQVSETIVRQITEEGAFGEPKVREVSSSRKDFVITWAKAEPYVWDDESTITVDEFKKAIADRELTLAEIKRRNDEYKASKNSAGGAFNTTTTSSITTPNTGVFNF
jgi:hypothetical protein